MKSMENPMQIYVDHNLPGCSGCRICEKMCALFHEKKYNPAYSRIKIYQFYPGPIDVPIVCQYCDDRPCVKACPTEALIYDTDTFNFFVALEAILPIIFVISLALWAFIRTQKRQDEYI